MFAQLPTYAAFAHAGVRHGFEVAWFRSSGATLLLEGGTTGIEDGSPWSVQYRVDIDKEWQTTRVQAVGVSSIGHRRLSVEVRNGHWWVDGAERPDLDGCVDIDFESSLVTNTLAVHRLELSSSTPVDVPAAFVRTLDLRVERLEQTYQRGEPTGSQFVFDYTSPTFDFACQLIFDASGLILEYPGIGHRVA